MSLTYRTLDLLACFTPDQPIRSLSELSHHSGLPLTTTHRIVTDLVEWGALERTADGGLQIGLRLWEVASLAPRGLGLRERALPFLEDLYVVTRQNVQLAVREGLELVFVERHRRPRRGPGADPGRRPLLAARDRRGAGAAGARSGRRPGGRHGERPLPAYTPFTITDRGRPAAPASPRCAAPRLCRERSDGDRGRAVRRRPGRTVLGGGRRGRLSGGRDGTSTRTPHALAPAVRTAARGISRALGAH